MRRSTATASVWRLMLLLTVFASGRTWATPPVIEGTLQEVPIEKVHVDDTLWAPRLDANRKVTIPHNLRELERQGSLGGFAILAGKSKENYHGYMWGDSDVYKTIEGIALCLQSHPDPDMQRRMEQIVATIVGAQDNDGYLFPHVQLAEPDYERFSQELSRTAELYSMGHAIESAVTHFQVTGRRTYLDAAERLADLIDRTYESGNREVPSGHPEIELALVRLYRATGERRYLDLSATLVERAKHTSTSWSHGKPPLGHREAIGHAVAMFYLYAAATEVAALTDDGELLALMRHKWDNAIGRKMYITGGVGHRRYREGFAPDYVLPNRDAYAETCAAVANVIWNQRMFLASGDAKYIDVVERALYNGFLVGAGQSGDRFFYVNPLEADSHRKFNHGSRARCPWYGCPCCPTNVVRFLPTIPGLAYATARDQIYVNLFIAGTATMNVDGTTVQLKQATDYPWDGDVSIAVAPENTSTFTLRVRIPGWVQGRPVPHDLYRYDDGQQQQVKLAINGTPVAVELEKGYAAIRRQWRKGDVVGLVLPMPVRRVVSHPKVEANAGLFAVERGPIVYCAEGADNGGNVLQKSPGADATFATRECPELLGGIVKIVMTPKGEGEPMTLIPYHAWCHRGPNEMAVWLTDNPRVAPPPPPPTIASQSRASASFCFASDTLAAINDQIAPRDSRDMNVPRHTFWNHLGSEEWLQYEFSASTKVSAVEIYWFDDRKTGRCWVPASWRLLYRDGDEWKPVTGATPCGTAVDRFNRVTFDSVVTDGLRIELKLRDNCSGGVLEWRVH